MCACDIGRVFPSMCYLCLNDYWHLYCSALRTSSDWLLPDTHTCIQSMGVAPTRWLAIDFHDVYDVYEYEYLSVFYRSKWWSCDAMSCHTVVSNLVAVHFLVYDDISCRNNLPEVPVLCTTWFYDYDGWHFSIIYGPSAMAHRLYPAKNFRVSFKVALRTSSDGITTLPRSRPCFRRCIIVEECTMHFFYPSCFCDSRDCHSYLATADCDRQNQARYPRIHDTLSQMTYYC